MLQGSQWPQDPTLLDNSDDQSSWKDELGVGVGTLSRKPQEAVVQLSLHLSDCSL